MGASSRALDNAASWTVFNRGWPTSYEIKALVIDPKTPTTLYVTIYMAGVFKSTDGGTSWAAINKGLPRYVESRVEVTSLYVEDLAIDPQTPTTLYAIAFSNSDDALFKSTNGGAAWVYSNLGSH